MLPRRPVVRALLVDHAYRLLLLHVTDGASTWWEAPGDRLARGEDAAGAVLRVLRDEAAVASGVRAGPCVWTLREGRSETRWHVAWLDDPNAPGAAPVTATTLGARWWTLDELASSAEAFRPPHVPALAPPVVRGEYGARPEDVARWSGVRHEENLDCRMFARCTPERAAAVLRPLLGPPVGFGNTFAWRGLEVDVSRNDDRDRNLGEDWLLWPATLWVEVVAGTPRAEAVASVAAVLRAFWDRGIDALAACSFEDDLPYAGGRDRPLGGPGPF